MANIKRPRHGSLQFWPRVKSKRPYAKVSSWAKTKNPSLLGFVGYKVGMTHIVLKDSRSNSQTKGETVTWPVTVIECPSIKVLSLRFYKQTPYGFNVVSEVLNPKADKDLARKISLAKKQTYDAKIKELGSKLDQFDDIRLLIYTQPKKTGIGKKRPEVMEIGLGGDNVKSKFDYALSVFDKEIRVSDVLKAGIKIDVHGVTKGKGFQGPVKRFGIQLMSHKAEKKRRTAPWGPGVPAKIHWGMILPGRLGFNLRTEYNKDLVLVADKPEKVNPKGGFMHYGLVKNDFVLVKGSVPGHVSRLITLTNPVRGMKGFGQSMEVQHISQESKQ